jgi:hypothetical protein
MAVLMTPENRSDLAASSDGSLALYERIRQVRESRALVAAGTLDDFVLGNEIGNLPELEASLLRFGDDLRELQALNPGDPDIVQALHSHEARKTALGL